MEYSGVETGTTIEIWDVSRDDDYRNWLREWNDWPHREIFAHPGYVRLFAQGVGSGKCAFMRTEVGTVLYPFVQREIPAMPGQATGLTDLISPYGYGGCFAWDVLSREWLQHEFVSRFSHWTESERVVSEFVRLSLFDDGRLDYPTSVRERSANVVRSLSLSEEGLWYDYDAKVRKNVKKALRSNVRIEVDESGNSVDAFSRVFASTMDRRDASSSYRYSLKFFEDLFSTLRGHIAIVNAVYESTVVSTELVLISARSVYSFLGGTLSSYFDVRPNDLLKHEIHLWAKDEEKESYVLGGGYQPNDGIFRYKKAFAPHGVTPFFTGERILNQDHYDALVALKERQRLEEGSAARRDTSFFPLYRLD
jgi:hypothetical protein